jgi:hypothetical protein
VTIQPHPKLELNIGSEIPTERAPEEAALAARVAAKALAEDENEWDSEAPTAVVTDRPLLPRPPRAPQL